MQSYKPPYTLTPKIFQHATTISNYLGQLRGYNIEYLPVRLRKSNQIKSIQSSLAIEGNSLSVEQITAIVSGKKIAGPIQDIREVLNAIEVYKELANFNPFKENNLLSAHGVLMEGLIPDAGKYRSGNVGVFDGDKVVHMAPSSRMVPKLMGDLFNYAINSSDPMIIRSSVFHYEFEFIHPFSDGNGRMGRLWQTLLLSKENPVFKFVPFETVIKERQQGYYDALRQCNSAGESTIFIEYMLSAIEKSLEEMLDIYEHQPDWKERIFAFQAYWNEETFKRKNYMSYHKNISTATASNDLKQASDQEIAERFGERINTIYRFK